MGRIFEKRKHVMFARFKKMSKAFNRIGKDIEIAVKAGGIDPKANSHLRIAIQNAKSVKTELEAILSRFKRKKRHTILKIKGKKLADDPLPPDDPAGHEGGGEGEDGDGGAKEDGADEGKGNGSG